MGWYGVNKNIFAAPRVREQKIQCFVVPLGKEFSVSAVQVRHVIAESALGIALISRHAMIPKAVRLRKAFPFRSRVRRRELPK
jgi:hypothetical protein